MNYWIWSHFCWVSQPLHMRGVTRPIIRGKMHPHFWNPWPQFFSSLCHFQGATTNHVRGKNSTHCYGHRVHCACTVSCYLYIGGPPKPHRAIFFTSYRLFTIQLLWGYDDNYKLFIGEHSHVKAVFGHKKQVQSKSVSKMVAFCKMGSNIKIVIWTPKRHILTQNDVLWRILRKNPFRGLGCRELQDPKKGTKN